MKVQSEQNSRTVLGIVEQYRIDKMPKLRHSTQRVAELWLKKHVLPRWVTTTSRISGPSQPSSGLSHCLSLPRRGDTSENCCIDWWTMPCGAVRFLLAPT